METVESAAVGDLALATAFEESSYLVFAFALMFGLMAFHIAWMAKNRGERRNQEKGQPVDAEEDGMVVCPECSSPTEVEYRYCQHCVADLGSSFVDLGGEDGGERSGMF